ncbi:hypothetical protein J4727_12375 [Providencia rettgeri]|uniref:Uncharacterized protein n=1 Tax=Providencia rettgeri TaxID=587 RepID=A0A939NBH7_PRORE|nr:hypothetical protein [Providencia rettgeri]
MGVTKHVEQLYTHFLQHKRRKIQNNTDLINDQITSIQKDNETEHHALDSKLKEVELYVQDALIGVNAADQVTEQLLPIFRILIKKLLKHLVNKNPKK